MARAAGEGAVRRGSRAAAAGEGSVAGGGAPAGGAPGAWLLRPVRAADLEALLELARFLDSPNLPRERAALARAIEASEAAFARPGPPHPERVYRFALEDPAGAVVGTSAIFSKHGTPDAPHVFLRVTEEERYAPTVGIRVRHRVFRLGAAPDGPSELGALVLHPRARGRRGAGRLLSWGRFAYIARHREAFEKELIAEMRAALDPRGRNLFWEAFGRRFTGMRYEEADARSATDKQFILDLFPEGPFYAALLPDEVLEALGRPHPEAEAAVRLLEEAGFRWRGEIDPFDAGPFYSAPTDEVFPVRATRFGTLDPAPPAAGAPPAIVSVEDERGFRASIGPASVEETPRGGAAARPGRRGRARAPRDRRERPRGVDARPRPARRSAARRGAPRAGEGAR